MMLKSGTNYAKVKLDDKHEHIVHIANVFPNDMRICVLTDKSVHIINICKETNNEIAKISHDYKLSQGPPSLKLQ